MSKRIHVGTFRTRPGDLTKNRGHDYGMGRKSEAHQDKRSKRRKTRAAQLRESLKGW